MSIIILFLNIFLNLLKLLILVRIVLSWFRMPIPHRIAQFLMETTEPIMGFFRKIIPPMGMFDFSPIVAFLAIDILQALVYSLPLS